MDWVGVSHTVLDTLRVIAETGMWASLLIGWAAGEPWTQWNWERKQFAAERREQKRA